MSTDALSREKLLPLSEFADALPEGPRINLETLRRWVTNGISVVGGRVVRLSAVRLRVTIGRRSCGGNNEQQS